ncbi:CesT family type III secretion system chaperone [Endozoicomonas sp. SM1973]|uniref:CesT family type III secretion system chaperone n=1 Tax=Spartinivicinus marinus TaxID=2994442 RepID=A0A853HX38_9GAMM|nr:CesT family type III secretion system chaperone [Spartinivicinus marinus]MCX4024663.1 CesT family type III secretion system chaperone [Spartinivicinus marinus]NYZ66310.1 CesT family type III secretion system chaperone [Spartinivicinus marinus]
MVTLAALVDSLTKKLQISQWQISGDSTYQLDVDGSISLTLFTARQRVFIISAFGQLSDDLIDYPHQLARIYQLALLRASDYQDALITTDKKQMQLQRQLVLNGLTSDQFEAAISAQLNYADELLLIIQQSHSQKLTNSNVWFP